MRCTKSESIGIGLKHTTLMGPEEVRNGRNIAHKRTNCVSRMVFLRTPIISPPKNCWRRWEERILFSCLERKNVIVRFWPKRSKDKSNKASNLGNFYTVVAVYPSLH